MSAVLWCDASFRGKKAGVAVATDAGEILGSKKIKASKLHEAEREAVRYAIEIAEAEGMCPVQIITDNQGAACQPEWREIEGVSVVWAPRTGNQADLASRQALNKGIQHAARHEGPMSLREFWQFLEAQGGVA